MKKEVTKCWMCGRGICKPKVFCTTNCEEHYQEGFKVIHEYDDFYKVADWIVVVGNEKHPKGSLYLG